MWKTAAMRWDALCCCSTVSGAFGPVGHGSFTGLNNHVHTLLFEKETTKKKKNCSLAKKPQVYRGRVISNGWFTR